MMNIKKMVTILSVLLISITLYAQSSEVVTDILNSKEVTFGQVCYLSAVQQGLVNDEASYEDAINTLYQKKQIPETYYQDSVVPMANLAFIYARMWDVKGGLFYRLFKGAPRYAFKQLKADGIIADYIDPTTIASGVDALNLYTACAFKYGNEDFTDTSSADESTEN